jgi:hypothetical protein
LAPVLIGDLIINPRTNATTNPIEPTRVTSILSDIGIGCSHAIVVITAPDIPKNTARNMLIDLSTAFSLPPEFLPVYY